MPTLAIVRRAQAAATVVAVLASLGCAERKPLAPPAAAGHTPATSAPPVAAPKITAVRAAVTGALVRRGDAVEICPGKVIEPCAGIRVEGAIDDAWLSSDPAKVSVWRLTGSYDGATLKLDAPAQPTTLAAERNYRNSCPELQKPMKGVNPPMSLSTTVEGLVSEHVERVAGVWWDRERQAMVVWVTGDAADLKRVAAERAPGARICVQGDARFSQPELERARTKADAILRERGVVWSGSGDDVVRNQIVYEADAIDAETLAQLERETGGAIAVLSFIELLDRKLEQMPAPPQRGDVALVTAKNRGGAMMSALGRFTVHYDPKLRCVYLSTPEERVLPVWPFGFWATSSPLKIYDHDDVLVAEDGQALEMGGGQVEVQHVSAGNACGAKSAWVGRPQAPSTAR